MAGGTSLLMVLVDTSVWIDFFLGGEALHVKTLETLISDGEDLCICGVILTEILQGIRVEKEYKQTKNYLEDLIYLPMSRKSFVKASDMYRTMRKKRITIRKSIDCMIAACALEHNVRLLHNDRDFDFIEKHFGLKII
jgi:predicted nucleic acid-binding protein